MLSKFSNAKTNSQNTKVAVALWSSFHPLWDSDLRRRPRRCSRLSTKRRAFESRPAARLSLAAVRLSMCGFEDAILRNGLLQPRDGLAPAPCSGFCLVCSGFCLLGVTRTWGIASYHREINCVWRLWAPPTQTRSRSSALPSHSSCVELKHGASYHGSRERWAQKDRRGRFVYLCFKLFCFQPLESALYRSLQCLEV